MKSRITQLLAEYEQAERMRLVRYRAKYVAGTEESDNTYSLLR